ncbi:MAG TPA: response regulator, partial [Polyangiaceae bacterium]|nr:response regulator [Polyangiaceae bacterium]
IQQELAESQDRYFELYELAPVGYATLDADGRVLFANLTLATQLQVERRRLVGSIFAERVTPDDRERFAAFLAEALQATPTQLSLEVQLRRAEDVPCPVMLRVVASEEERPAIRIAVVDLTDLKKAEERVRERESRLQAVLDTVADGIVTVNADGKIESANAAACRLFRTSPAWLVGRFVHRILPGFIGLAERGRSELLAYRPDASTFSAEVAVTALAPLSARRGLVGVITDVSERKQHEADLEEALTRFRQIAEHIEDAIFVVDANTGQTLYVSPAFAAISGRAQAETEHEQWPCLSLVHAEDRERVAAMASMLRDGKAFDATYRIVRPDGSVRTVSSRAFLLAEQNRITGILHDMTEELRLQAELRQAQRLEAIGTLASGVAHDFNNLLMGVGGCAQLALRRLDPEHPAYGYLRRAVDAILRGANLTRQILRFSDTRRSSDDPVELDTVVMGARDLIHSLVGEQIALSVIAGAPGLTIAADAGDLEQVLLNLASNARDAMPNGGLLVFRTEPQQGGMVALTVRDTGVGMSEETKRRIFEPFFTTKEVGKGTGLGLSTVFAVLRRMGGTISIDSALGEGTTFTLSLPVVIVDESTDEAPDAAPGAGQTILIVDDDPLVRMTVETHVQSLGYRALTASSVTDALRVYTESTPLDVVLTDVMMPGLLGSDLGRILQKSAPGLAVIFMSAHPRHDLVERGYLQAGSRLLAKPFDARELGRALQQALKDKPRARPRLPMRVFVVDDDPDVLDALRDFLALEGHLVSTAQSSSTALERIPVFAPDVVLCDINVDEAMSGLDLVSKLRDEERLSKTVFLAVTGMALNQCGPAARAAGFDDVLTKPLDFHRLSSLLASHVTR